MIDASIVLSWLLPDEDSGLTLEVKERFSDSEFWAPAHWKLEISNALCVAERRGRLAEAGVLEALELIAGLPVAIDDSSDNRSLSSTVSLARRHSLSVYDAAYLELAIRLGATLCSLDRDLVSASERVGLAAVPPIDNR